MRISSAHYLQCIGRAECAVKAAKNLVTGNCSSTGTVDTDKFLRTNLAYRNGTIYSETGKTIAQSLMGRHLRGALPAVKEFYLVKREFIKDLPKLAVGDNVRVQNQTMVRPTKWDKTGVVMAILSNRKY